MHLVLDTLVPLVHRDPMAKSHPDILLDSYSDDSDEGELTVEDAVNLAVQNSQRVNQINQAVRDIAVQVLELQAALATLRGVLHDDGK